MKNTKDFVQVVAEKKATLEVLEELMERLNSEENYVWIDYRCTGEVQREDSDGNLLYIDENGNRTTEVTSTPCMKSRYEDVKKTDGELTDRDRAKLAAIEKIRETLAALA